MSVTGMMTRKSRIVMAATVAAVTAASQEGTFRYPLMDQHEDVYREREACPQRAFPVVGRALHINEDRSRSEPYPTA